MRMVGPRVFKLLLEVGQDQQMTTGHFNGNQLKVKVTMTVNIKGVISCYNFNVVGPREFKLKTKVG